MTTDMRAGAEDRRRPKYTVRAVARMTAVGAATLRAWEKRYGVPAPARTPSRYRLYSEDDVLEIRWMRDRVGEGIPPRQAARLAAERREAGIPLAGPVNLAPPLLAADMKAAVLAFDEDRAQEILRRAASVMRPAEIMRHVVLVTIADIGRGWEAGLVTIAQEHFASQLARRYAGHLLDLYQAREGVPPVVCACAPGEQHELGLLALAIEIRSRGIPVVYLGPDVPLDSLLSSAQSVQAGLAVIAVTLEDHMAHLAAARETVARLQRATGSPVVWAGPAAVHVAKHGLPGTAVHTIDEALVEILASVRRRGSAGKPAELT